MWIEIFKTGTHTDSDGNTRTWNKQDLDRIASQYNPAIHEAPVVIGHPKVNAPAYGWVEDLKREGGTLFANLKELVPEFVDLLKRKLYKKRSVSLYPDTRLGVMSRYELASSLAVLGRIDEAIVEYQAIIDLEPDSDFAGYSRNRIERLRNE